MDNTKERLAAHRLADSMDKFPLGEPINTLNTDELIDELTIRIQQTNGMEFVITDRIRFLSNSLTNELADRAITFETQLNNIIYSPST